MGRARPQGIALLSCWMVGVGRGHRLSARMSAAPSPASAVDLSVACPHFADCPGCTLGAALDAPPKLARARAFFAAECGLAHIPSVMGAPLGWRTHAKLAVRGVAGAPLIGLFKARSHDVLPVPDCAVHHPSINMALAELQVLMVRARTPVYDEATGAGLVRYLQATVERSSGLVQLVLVCNAPAPAAVGEGAGVPRGLEPLLALLAAAARTPDSVWHSVWLHFNDERRNNIFSFAPSPAGRWLRVLGEATVRERVGARTFEFPPSVFRQANLDAFEAIAAEVAAAVPAGARVCELYSGVGLLGLNCLEAAEWVRCSDANPSLDDAVVAALAALPPPLRSRASYRRCDAAASTADLVGADTLIVDPPRKGLEPPLLAELCAAREAGGAACGLNLLVYVSCGYDALERDARALVGAGWRVRSARAHVLVPGADHIETVAIFTR
jgi:tRNA/tmRNA/rRNA uracil-C5-methylase (TrmA/RlmC/RlmD family)